MSVSSDSYPYISGIEAVSVNTSRGRRSSLRKDFKRILKVTSSSNDQRSDAQQSEEPRMQQEADEQEEQQQPPPDQEPQQQLSSDFGCVCCECHSLFSTQWELLQHVRLTHPDAATAYVCWHCGREFGMFYRMVRHVVKGEGCSAVKTRPRSGREVARGPPERMDGAATSRSPPSRDRILDLVKRYDDRNDENVDPRRQLAEERQRRRALAKGLRPFGQSRLVNS